VKAGSTLSSRTFMRMRSRANSLAMTTQPRRWRSLFPDRRTTSSSWVDASQDRCFLYPISALASLFTLRVLPCPTACTHTLREEPRYQAVFVARGFALVATVSPSFLLSPLWPSHRHSPAPTQPSPCTPRAKAKHPDRDHLTALFHLTAEDILPTA
jgi:hypothetical protein